MSVSIIVLTYNSAATIGATLDSAFKVSDDVHIVDSYSEDETLDIAAKKGACIVQHPFEHYGAQRNWAIDTLEIRHPWQLHLDADERLSDALAEKIRTVVEGNDNVAGAPDGYMLPRLVHFLGRPLRHGGMYPIWHLRLFRNGKGRCESRHYDQHFYMVDGGQVGQLDAPMIDDNRAPLSDWTARHNRWSDAEVAEILGEGGQRHELVPDASGNAIERQLARRRAYYRKPMFVRAFALFLYRYIVRLGFLDGREGLIFYVLQSFWYRFLVDAKLYERRQQL